MYKFENWTWCRCWLPLLGIAGEGGCTRRRIGRGAVAGCHCWAAIAGDGGGVDVHVGGVEVVALLAAIAGLPLLGIGGGCWRIGCGDVAGCRCWVPW